MCMKFEEFVKTIKDEIIEYLPKEYIDAEVEIKNVEKNNNVKMTGLAIRKKGENVTPTIYLEELYKEYSTMDEEMEFILNKIADARMKADGPNFDIEEILNPINIKNKVFGAFLGKEEWNSEAAKNYPYIKIRDLIMIFKIPVESESEENGTATIKITRNIQEKVEYTTEQLYNFSLENMKTGSMKPEMISMQTILAEMMGVDPEMLDEADVPLFVITNEKKLFGANVLMNEEFMNNVCKRLKDDIVIIPSSIHEVIIMREKDVPSKEYINSMINDVNEGQVAAEDRLSNHYYIWRKDSGLMM